jgi:hypothetical protein
VHSVLLSFPLRERLRMPLPVFKYKLGTADGTMSVIEMETQYYVCTVLKTNPCKQN